MNKALILGGAVLVTAASLGLALFLGGWGFDQRRFSLHEGRLRRLVEKEPRLEQVVEGLKAEDSLEVGVARNGEELARLAERWGRGRRGLVLEKGRRWSEVHVFEATDMLYFLYFDGARVLRDFVCVSR